MARKNTLQLDAKLMKKMQTSKFAVSQNDICGKRYGRQTFGVVKNRNRGTKWRVWHELKKNVNVIMIISKII